MSISGSRAAKQESAPLAGAHVSGLRPAARLHPDASQVAPGRRKEARWPGASGPFEAWAGGVRVKLVDFSQRGLGLVVLAEGYGGGQRVEVELRQGRQPFARLTLEVTHSAPVGGGRFLGGRVTAALPAPSGISMPGRGDAVEVKDDAQRAAIVDRLRRSSPETTLHLPSGGVTRAHLRSTVEPPSGALDPAEGGPTDLRIEPLAGHAGGWPEGTATVQASLFGGCFTLQGRLERPSGGGFVLRSPRIFSVGRRQHGRVTMPTEHATLDFRHPLDPSRWVSAAVVDLSPTGALVALGEDAALLLPPPGVPLLLCVGGLQVPVRAEVRHTGRASGLGVVAGLRITPQIDGDSVLVTRACQALRFPELLARARAEPDEVDTLMKASGYLSLRETTTPAPGWHAPAGDEQLTVDLVHRGSTGKPVGHGSYLRLYPNTWLFHQLATVGLRRAAVAYPLYVQAVEWALSLSDRDAFALSYFNQSKSWHRTMLGDFLRWVGSESLSTITSLDRLERGPSPGRVEVAGPAAVHLAEDEDDRAFAAELARSFLPPLVADALHISPRTVVTDSLSRHHDQAGLERSRTALIVEVAGQPLGVALCETGSRTLSLFNILNMAHVFFIPTIDPRHARGAQAKLLTAVLDFYAARGILDPLVVTPESSVLCPEDVGLTVTESMGCWVASREGLKQWKNYVHFALGPLSERRRGARPHHRVDPRNAETPE